jgi:hypothetical protein
MHVAPWLARIGVVLLVAAAPVGVYVAPGEPPSYPEKWDPRVAGLVGFVERERGLRFEHPVDVEFLAGAAFEAKIRTPAKEQAEEREQLQRFLGELRALGLVEGDPDLGEDSEKLAAKSIVGLYDPEQETLFVRGEQPTTYVKGVVVHELTHALQDQHFDLQAMDDRAPAGAEVATTALVEGDAVRVQQAYRRQLSEAEQQVYGEQESEAEDRASDTEDVPRVLQDLLAFPYVFGPTYLDSLQVQGGNPAVDAAFRHPPVSEAQVVTPLEHGTSYRPEKVDAPRVPAGGKAVDEPGAFGQFTLFEVLGQQLGRARAWDAVAGWAGDRYVSYTSKGRSCLAIRVLSTTENAAAVLGTAVRDWRQGLPDVVLGQSGRTVDITACDPGAGAHRPEHTPRAFDALSARAGVIHELVQEGRMGLRKATCITDEVVAAVGDRLLTATEQPAPAAQERINRAFEAAYLRC